MSLVRRIALIIGTAAVVLGLCGSGAQAHRGTTLYVSPHGSDSALGTARSPLRTPQLAVDRLGRSGGTVLLAGGRYARQRIVIKDRAHVTVRAAARTTPVLDGTGLGPLADQSGMVELRDS